MTATHGIKSTYNTGCRCDPCTDANTAYSRKQQQKRAEAVAANASNVPHGMSGYFNWGCRCDRCKQASREHFVGDWDISRAKEPWTEDEAQMAVRTDLPVWMTAQRLKRPYQSVVRKRQALRKATS
jgi:hypothetical protein